MKIITWRWYEEKDKAAVQECYANLLKKIGKDWTLPDLMEEPVIAAVVGEIDGKVVTAIFAEAEVEVQIASSEILAANEIQGAMDLLLPIVKGYRLNIARCFVPSEMLTPTKNKRPAAIERMLKKLGFTKENETVTQFFKWL